MYFRKLLNHSNGIDEKIILPLSGTMCRYSDKPFLFYPEEIIKFIRYQHENINFVQTIKKNPSILNEQFKKSGSSDFETFKRDMIFLSVQETIFCESLLDLLGIVITAKCFLNIDAIAKDVNKIDIEQALKKDDKKTELGKNVYSALKEVGIDEEKLNKLLKNNEFRQILNRYIASILLDKMQVECDIFYPTKEELKTFAFNNYELLGEDLTKEKVDKFLDENYYQIKLKLEVIAREIGDL